MIPWWFETRAAFQHGCSSDVDFESQDSVEFGERLRGRIVGLVWEEKPGFVSSDGPSKNKRNAAEVGGVQATAVKYLIVDFPGYVGPPWSRDIRRMCVFAHSKIDMNGCLHCPGFSFLLF